MGFAVDADPRYGRFGLRTECPRCGAHLPVNGPAPLVDCADCGHRVEVPDAILREVLDAFEDGWPDVKDAGSQTIGDLTWRWTSEPVEGPPCPACGARLDDAGDRTLIPCGCGAQVPSVPPPEAVRAVRGVARVIGGEADQTRDAAPQAPVVLACPACGAGLTITHEHQRITPCVHCGSQVHLPDAVWRQLHPPRTVRPWTVRFQGESRPAREARLARERAAREAEKRAEKEAREARKRAEQEERRRRQEEADRAEAARKAEEAARERAAREAQERRRQLLLLPLTVLSGLATAGALAWMLGASLAWALGHSHVAPRYGTGSVGARVVTDLFVWSGAAVALLAWAFGVLAAGLRGKKPLLGVFTWSAFMAGLSILPFAGPVIGLFFAWQHATDHEPTPDTDRLPRGTGWALVPLYVFGPLYAHLCYAAAGDMTLGELLRSLLD